MVTASDKGIGKTQFFNAEGNGIEVTQHRSWNGETWQTVTPCEARQPRVFEAKSAWMAVKSPAPMHEIVIEGLVRRGEVMNVIAATKVGKSWFATMLGFCVATGHEWLGRSVTKGNVLLIDNELHDASIQNRLATVCNAMGIDPQDGGHANFSYLSLRGELADIYELEKTLMTYKPGDLTLVVLDAKYRFFGSLEENSNEDQTIFHNICDKIAKHLNCVLVLIHHSTKGDQNARSVTDVGSGGGAQARAADCHLVIRPHQKDGLAVLDAAVRTFPPVSPQTLSWTFPLWVEAAGVEAILKAPVSRGDSKQSAKDKQALADIDAILREADKPMTRYELHKRFGGGIDRVSRLLLLGVKSDKFIKTETRLALNGKESDLYSFAGFVEPECTSTEQDANELIDTTESYN